MVKLPIYMDNNATTPLDPRVLEAMMPYLTQNFGNAASRTHSFGWIAEAAVEKGREQIARLINASSPDEIIFTSGATESDNLALKGIAWGYKSKGNHIITQKTEHKAVLDSCKFLQKEGYDVTYLDVDKYGLVDPETVRAAITDKTILISIMYANSEIGTVQPIREIGEIAKEKGVLFHCDAVQAAGKIPIDMQKTAVDLMALSGHKIYGPKGVGALYIRKKKPFIKAAPLIHGGGHEKGKRSGTLNVPGIVGFGAASELAQKDLPAEMERLKRLRERLREGLTTRLDYVHLNGHPEKRIPGSVNLSFEFVEGESLLMGLKDVAVSSGSACTSASLEPSYVLTAIGVGPELAHTSIRFCVGRFNTEEEVDYVIEAVVKHVTRLRELSPLYEMVLEGIDLNTINWNAEQ
ncbi:MAG: IscS subfamily cysteine desulfurase [Acidobacteriia bacterium]|nr:IscS subfamily cysteine desulfurase [Terriglobia bacterium]